MNVTDIVQLAATAKADPQLLVSAKSAGFVPPIAMLEIDSAAVPELLSVTVLAELVLPAASVLNDKVFGVKPAEGAGATPVPDSVTVWLEPVLELSVI